MQTKVFLNIPVYANICMYLTVFLEETFWFGASVLKQLTFKVAGEPGKMWVSTAH